MPSLVDIEQCLGEFTLVAAIAGVVFLIVWNVIFEWFSTKGRKRASWW